MTDEPMQTALLAAGAVTVTVSAAGTAPAKAKRRRRSKRARKDQIDIAKVLLAPVKLLQGARTRTISAFEATLRAQVTKAIDGKDSASIKALIDHAIRYDLVVSAEPPARTCGVFIIPKGLNEADQREIFDTETTSMNRIIEIILRHYDKQER